MFLNRFSAVFVKRTLLMLPLLWAVSFAGQSVAEQTWTVNFKDTDIQELIRFVANASKKTIIIDPKVKGKVQVISAKPVNQQELYDLFLSILEVQGFAAIESNGVVRIVPAKDARSSPVPVVEEKNAGNNSEVITQVIQLENISAAKLIPVLRPLAPQQAHMAAYAPSNAIIISDTAANIQRIREIIDRIDRSAVEKTEVINLEHASAEEVVRMLQQLQKSQATKGQAETKKLLLVADKRTNSVLVNGDELERQRVKVLIGYLDTPLAQSGNVKVVYLEYADAKDLAAVLQKVVQNIEDMSPEEKGKRTTKSTATIEADEGTNALIITASADVMQSLTVVIERLDIRRAQVLVEAIIVEMTADNGKNLGVEWLFVDDDGGYGSVNATSQAVAPLANIDSDGNVDDDADLRVSIASAIANNVSSAIFGVGRLDDDLSFSVVLNALQRNVEANILSTPSLLTLDNEEASIVVGRNVPFVTGSYTSTSNGSSTPDSPFQTVERENVGITLQVTPQINEGDSLVLELSQEVSSVIPDGTGVGGNPITSERKVETKVLAGDGQTIVLGGLIEDNVSETVSKVPLLGDIPWIGRLFRNTSTTIGKKHLMIFLRPTIVRNSKTLQGATAEKYRALRNKQLQRIENNEYFSNGVALPLLPEWQQQMEALDKIRRQKNNANQTDQAGQ